jgi:CBS domain-containing protein
MQRTVADVMSGSVVAVRPAGGFKEIVTLMRQHNVSAVPVVDTSDQVIGIVSEADLLLKEIPVEESATASLLATGRRGERARAAGVTAADLMTSPVATIRGSAPVTDAARLMHDQRIKRLPVVDPDGRLIGIVSRIDVLSVFDRPDGQLRDELRDDVIRGRFRLDPAAFDVEVSSGIVTVSGLVSRRETAMRLLDAIQHSDGVVDVRNQLSYPREDQPEPTAARRWQ